MDPLKQKTTAGTPPNPDPNSNIRTTSRQNYPMLILPNVHIPVIRADVAYEDLGISLLLPEVLLQGIIP